MKNKENLLCKFADATYKTMLPILGVVSVLLNLILEILGRHSVLNALKFAVIHPIMFIYNSLIILFTLSFCLTVKKRLAALFLIIAVWLGLGITNCILIGYRSSPLSAIDFTIVKSVIGLFDIYLKIWQMILIGVSIVTALVFVIYLMIKSPKSKTHHLKSALCCTFFGLSVFFVNFFAVKIDAVDYSSLELADAYQNYGFVYCFSRSLMSQGIERPSDYSNDALDALKDSLENDTSTAPPDTVSDIPEDEEMTELPNIIFVQLESFFDLRRVTDIETSEEVTPNFNKLSSGISGHLKMENVGGGTANSEFEVLTGMNLDHFGFGEYPYTTILGSRPCESIAYSLKAIGYSTHAIHNHTATFYNRNTVYANLGFDSFTPAEMMNDLTYNPLGWERDEVMTEEILSALDSSDGVDFVFAVTVQCHGKYPEELPDAQDSYPDYELEYDPQEHITVSGCNDEKKLAQFTYYANQLRETDNFIGELITRLEERGEPCVVVFYGDHLPALGLCEDEVEFGLFNTDYAVWTNTDFFEGDEKEDFESYMLSAYILQKCNIDGGDISKLHQNELLTNTDRDDDLKLLEYAQLYDPDKVPVYKTVDMRFGTRELSVTDYTRDGNTIYISGRGFTQNCLVEISANLKSTEFISPYLIAVENIYFNDTPDKVIWVAEDKTELESVTIE